MLEFIVHPLKLFFLFLHDNIVAAAFTDKNVSFGLTIILFTFIVRMILLPLNVKQAKSQVKMNELQPEIKKLQTKHKGDAKKLQEETMKLYKEKEANPFGGCLPMVVQMPILFSLYYVFQQLQSDGTLNGVGFLWLNELTKPDIIKVFGLPLAILPILSGVTTYLSTKMMAPPKTAENAGSPAAQMGSMNIFMSIFMVFMSWNFPSALVLYWVVGNVFSIVQTYFLYKHNRNKDTIVSKA